MYYVYLFLIILIVHILEQSNAALNCNCKLGARKKIIGGYEAEQDFLPWSVIITENLVPICAGFILNERTIVTAAHCILSKRINTLEVVVGTYDLAISIPIQNFYDIVSINIPYDFDINKLQNGHDIALLRLNRDISFVRDKIEVACLRFINRKIDDLFVAGFGSTKKIEITNGVRSSGTYQTRMKYTSFFEPLKNRKKQYITGINKKKGEDACIRDSGSSANIQLNGKAYVVGIVSFSTYKKVSNDVQTMCNGITHFTRLSYEKKFIEFYVGKNYCV